MKQLRRLLDRTLEITGVLLLAAMVMVVCWQVISRYLLGTPSIWTEEWLRFSLVWLSMLGMALACGRRAHINLTILHDKAPPGMRTAWSVVLQGAFGIFALLVLILGGLKIAGMSMQQISPVLRIPMGQVYYALPVAGCIIILYCMLNIIDCLKNAAQTEVHHD